MSAVRKIKPSEALRSFAKRMIRLHGLESGVEMICEYVESRYYVKTFSGREECPRADVNLVINAVCAHFSVGPEIMQSKTRVIPFPYIRRVMQYFLVTRTDLSLSEVGRRFGRDHTTVMYSRNRTMAQLYHNVRLECDIKAIDELIRLQSAAKTIKIFKDAI